MVGRSISRDDSTTSSSRSFKASNRPSLCCRCASRRNVFSTMMTAPSMMSPKSSAPRLIRLPEMPNAFMPIALINSDKGITSAAMSAARQLPSRANRMTTTSSAPSARFLATVEIVATTSCERSRVGTTVMPAGRVLAISFSFVPTACATVRLLAPTSIRALPTTVSWPSRLAAPVRNSPPTLTFATCATVIGTPARVAITALAISSCVRMRPSARTR